MGQGEVKILVVANISSIHAARFISLLQEIGYNLRVFQCEPCYWIDEHLEKTHIYVNYLYSLDVGSNVIETKNPIKLTFSSDGLLLKLARKIRPRVGLAIQKGMEFLFGTRNRGKDLAEIIQKWTPDIVLSLRMQNEGYAVLEAKKVLGKSFRSKWVHFLWGTDIEFFVKNSIYRKKHLPLIKESLKNCDYLFADSLRDVKNAQFFGFRGGNLGYCVATGGFDIAWTTKVRRDRSKEKVILVKGREGGLVGKALNVVYALFLLKDELKDYKIKVIMPTIETKVGVNLFLRLGGLDCELVPRVPYKQILDLFAGSSIAISATDVDGTPSFLIESMALGAFPIHSDMSSVREWIEDGKNGLLFPVDDINKLKHCIRRAINDDYLLKTARKVNWEIIKKRADRERIKGQVKALFENVVLKK